MLDDIALPTSISRKADDLILAGTRIGLNTVLTHWDEGSTPEEIVASFPSLDLVAVYEAVAFALRHPEAIERYRARSAEAAFAAERAARARFDWSAVRVQLQARRAEQAEA